METKKIQLSDGIELITLNDYIGSLIEKNKDYYEKEVLSYFLDYVPVNSVIYDIGANIGNHTLYFSKYLRAQKIYSFEPVEETYKVLSSNVKNNSLQDRVTTFNCAVGEKDGYGELNINKENMGNSKISESQQGNVEVKSLDNMQLELPDFVKVDVEGFELNVLLGMRNILKGNKPILWVEIFSDSFQEVDKLLSTYGYVLVDRWLDNYIYFPLEKYNTEEIFNLIKNKAFKRYNFEINRLTLLVRDKNKVISRLQEISKSTSSFPAEGITTLLVTKIEQMMERENEIFTKFNEMISQQMSQMQLTNFGKNGIRDSAQDILTNLELIAREEELIQGLEEKVLELKRIEEDNAKLKLELSICTREKEIIERKYNSLKNSKAGKFMLKYWAFRNKRK